MLKRLRLVLKTVPVHPMGWTTRDPIEVDETYIGGKPKNMHVKRRIALGDRDHKTIVMGMLSRETREVRASAIADAKRTNLQGQILKNVGRSSHIYTDQHIG